MRNVSTQEIVGIRLETFQLLDSKASSGKLLKPPANQYTPFQVEQSSGWLQQEINRKCIVCRGSNFITSTFFRVKRMSNVPYRHRMIRVCQIRLLIGTCLCASQRWLCEKRDILDSASTF